MPSISRGAMLASGPGNIDQELLVIPPASEADRLIDNYFADTGLLYPFLHEHTFRQIYSDMKQSRFRPVRRSWLCLFNMVLAVSIRSDPNGIERVNKCATAASTYYNRANGLCGDDMFRGTNLELGMAIASIQRAFTNIFNHSSMSSANGLLPTVCPRLGENVVCSWARC